jgi:hypothetical protein
MLKVTKFFHLKNLLIIIHADFNIGYKDQKKNLWDKKIKKK